jgi:hypothetical protein
VPVAAPASGFDDVAEVEAVMNEQGVPDYDRVLALSTRDYNSMAGNLADRETMGSKVTKPRTSGHTLAGSLRSTRGSSTMHSASQRQAVVLGPSTPLNSAGTFYTPVAITTNPTTSERLNVDNRTQTVTVSCHHGCCCR